MVSEMNIENVLSHAELRLCQEILFYSYIINLVEEDETGCSQQQSSNTFPFGFSIFTGTRSQ